MNNKGVSPIVATALLIVFAIALGTVVMSLGKGYIDVEGEESPESVTVCIDPDSITDPLKQLQIRYITDEITKDEYDSEASSLEV